MVKLLYS